MPMPIDQDYLLLEQLTTDRLEIHPSPIFRRRSSASLVFSLGTELVDEQTRTSALHHLKPVLPDVTNKEEEDSVRAGAVRTESGLSAVAREVGRGHGLSIGAWSGRRMPFDDDGEVEGDMPPLVEIPPASETDVTDGNTDILTSEIDRYVYRQHPPSVYNRNYNNTFYSQTHQSEQQQDDSQNQRREAQSQSQSRSQSQSQLTSIHLDGVPYSLGHNYPFSVPEPAAPGSLQQSQSGMSLLESGPMAYIPEVYPPYAPIGYATNLPFASDLGLRDSYAYGVGLTPSTETDSLSTGKTVVAKGKQSSGGGAGSGSGAEEGDKEGNTTINGVGDDGGVGCGDASASSASSGTATVAHHVKMNQNQRERPSSTTNPGTRPMDYAFAAAAATTTIPPHAYTPFGGLVNSNSSATQTQMEVNASSLVHTITHTAGSSGNNAYLGHGYEAGYYHHHHHHHQAAFGGHQIYPYHNDHSHHYSFHEYGNPQFSPSRQFEQGRGAGQGYGHGHGQGYYSQAPSPSLADVGSVTPSRSPLSDAQQQQQPRQPQQQQNQSDYQSQLEGADSQAQSRSENDGGGRTGESSPLPQTMIGEQKDEIGEDGSNSGKASSKATSSPNPDLYVYREPASGPDRHARSALNAGRMTNPRENPWVGSGAREDVVDELGLGLSSFAPRPNTVEALPETFPPTTSIPPQTRPQHNQNQNQHQHQQLRIPNSTTLTVNTNPNRPPSYIPRPPNAFILFRASFVRAQSLGGEALSEFAKTIGIHGVTSSSSSATSSSTKDKEMNKEKMRMAGATGAGKGVSALGRESKVTITPSHDPGGGGVSNSISKKRGKNKSKSGSGSGSRRSSPIIPGSPPRWGGTYSDDDSPPSRSVTSFSGGEITDITTLVMAYIEKAQQAGSAAAAANGAAAGGGAGGSSNSSISSSSRFNGPGPDPGGGRGRGKGRVRSGVGDKSNKNSKSPPPDGEGGLELDSIGGNIRIGKSKDPGSPSTIAQASISTHSVANANANINNGTATATATATATPASSTTLSKLAGQLWRALAPAEREIWERRAKVAQAEHRKKYPDWRFRPENLNRGTEPRFVASGTGGGGGEVLNTAGVSGGGGGRVDTEINLGLGMGVGTIGILSTPGEGDDPGSMASTSKKAGKEKEKTSITSSFSQSYNIQDMDSKSPLVLITDDTKTGIQQAQQVYQRDSKVEVISNVNIIKTENDRVGRISEIREGSVKEEEDGVLKVEGEKKTKSKGSGRPRGRPRKDKGKARAEAGVGVGAQEQTQIKESISILDRTHTSPSPLGNQSTVNMDFCATRIRDLSKSSDGELTTGSVTGFSHGEDADTEPMERLRPFPTSNTPMKASTHEKTLQDRDATNKREEKSPVRITTPTSLLSPAIAHDHNPSLQLSALDTSALVTTSSTPTSPLSGVPKRFTDFLPSQENHAQKHRRISPLQRADTSLFELDPSFFDGGPLRRRHTRTGTVSGVIGTSEQSGIRGEREEGENNRLIGEGREGPGLQRTMIRRNTVSVAEAASGGRAGVLMSSEIHGSPPSLSPSPTSPASPPFSPYTPFSPYSTPPFPPFTAHHHRHGRVGHTRHHSLVSFSHPSPLSINSPVFSGSSIVHGRRIEHPRSPLEGLSTHHHPIQHPQTMFRLEDLGPAVQIPIEPRNETVPRSSVSVSAERSASSSNLVNVNVNPNPGGNSQNRTNAIPHISNYSSLTGWAGASSIQASSSEDRTAMEDARNI